LAFAVILTSVLAQAASSMMKTEYAQTSQSPAFVAGTGSSDGDVQHAARIVGVGSVRQRGPGGERERAQCEGAKAGKNAAAVLTSAMPRPS
jgi:hypothetical protein